GANPEHARLVGARRHHAAPCGAADEDGFAAQCRIVPLLDRRVERVEVDMQDGRHYWKDCSLVVAIKMMAVTATSRRVHVHCGIGAIWPRPNFLIRARTMPWTASRTSTRTSL